MFRSPYIAGFWLSFVAYAISFLCPAVRLQDFKSFAWGWEAFLLPIRLACTRGIVFFLLGWLPNLMMWAGFYFAWQRNDALAKRFGVYAFLISLAFWGGWLHGLSKLAGYYLWTLSMLLMAVFAILRERNRSSKRKPLDFHAVKDAASSISASVVTPLPVAGKRRGEGRQNPMPENNSARQAPGRA